MDYVIESYIGSGLIVIKTNHTKLRRRRQLLPAKHESRKVLHHFARPAKLSSNSIPCGPHGPAFPRGFSGFPFPIAFLVAHSPSQHKSSHSSRRCCTSSVSQRWTQPQPKRRGTTSTRNKPSLKHTSHSQQNPWRKPWASTPSTQNPREGKKDFVFFFLPLLLELKLVEVSWD